MIIEEMPPNNRMNPTGPIGPRTSAVTRACRWFCGKGSFAYPARRVMRMPLGVSKVLETGMNTSAEHFERNLGPEWDKALLLQLRKAVAALGGSMKETSPKFHPYDGAKEG
jgi:hypothetical protein